MNAPENKDLTILELVVRNHPGVMSHVCGLFSRRCYNVEGIVCLPVGDGKESKIIFQVGEEERLDQVIKQIKKLSDVISVERLAGNHPVFTEIKGHFG